MRFLYFVICSTLTLYSSTKEPLEIGTMGLPMIQVQFLDASGKTKPARFLLDTGSNITIIDQATALSLGSKHLGNARIISASGMSTDVKHIKLHGIRFGEKLEQNITAVTMDLKNSVGTLEDGEFDGILGMDLLNNTQFIVDYESRTIEWNPGNIDRFQLLPLRRSTNRLPILNVSFSSINIEMVCDTGASDFMTLIKSELKGHILPLKGKKSAMTSDLGGGLQQVQDSVYDGMAMAGKVGWCSPTIEISDSGGTSIIGIEALGFKTLFDFKTDKLGIISNPNGCITVRPPIRCPIALKWETRRGVRYLVVIAVKPNSVYEKINIQPGDVLLKADDLTGEGLTIRSLREKLITEKVKEITIQRGKRQIILSIQDLPST